MAHAPCKINNFRGLFPEANLGLLRFILVTHFSVVISELNLEMVALYQQLSRIKFPYKTQNGQQQTG